MNHNGFLWGSFHTSPTPPELLSFSSPSLPLSSLFKSKPGIFHFTVLLWPSQPQARFFSLPTLLNPTKSIPWDLIQVFLTSQEELQDVSLPPFLLFLCSINSNDHQILLFKGGAHSSHDYNGTWIPQIPRWALLRYTKAGERVMSNFLGRGTDAIEAFLLNRPLLGIDVNPVTISFFSFPFPSLIHYLAFLCPSWPLFLPQPLPAKTVPFPFPPTSGKRLIPVIDQL